MNNQRAIDILISFWSGVALVTIFCLIISSVSRIETYLIASDGMKVESVVEFSSRGKCLEQMEKNMEGGPHQLVWQCVDKK